MNRFQSYRTFAAIEERRGVHYKKQTLPVMMSIRDQGSGEGLGLHIQFTIQYAKITYLVASQRQERSEKQTF